MHNNERRLSHLGFPVLLAFELPPPEAIYGQVYALAFPQILAWCTAAAGALFLVLLIKNFKG
jgi:hypothetical protein